MALGQWFSNQSCEHPQHCTFCRSLISDTPIFQVLLSLLMSWWVESGVIYEGDTENVQCWGCSQDWFENHCSRVTRRRQIWIKSFFLGGGSHKKYSRSFVKLRLNPWCHLDYFTDLLAMFLDLDRVRTLAVYGGSESSQIPSKIS